MESLQLHLNECLYTKDPQSTDLGRKIIRHSTILISELGFEAFTFKKLSKQIESTEASIYRYFENKHRLLLYLISWYWAWLEYRIDEETAQITNASDRLDCILKIITEQKLPDEAFPNIDERALNKIVICESDKTYLTKQVDFDNREGLFKGYKYLCKSIATLIQEINPQYPFPHALISTTLEAAHQQIFFAEHLPRLTEMSDRKDPYGANYQFLKNMIFKTINITHE